MSLSNAKRVGPDFQQAAKPVEAKPKREARKPFCIRLSDEERSLLERMAGNKPVGAYSREKLLGDAQEPRKAAKPAPKMDYVLLGQILAVLGKSELAANICLLATAAQNGSLVVDDEIAAELQSACKDIHHMCFALITALGVKPDDGS
ncbi:MAG: hypothetical protein GKS00_10480 [Alphaproteobacteria bacterium]|nr:hypothetical protein [Alphaproteobacteria bacterium]